MAHEPDSWLAQQEHPALMGHSTQTHVELLYLRSVWHCTMCLVLPRRIVSTDSVSTDEPNLRPPACSLKRVLGKVLTKGEVTYVCT